MEVELLISDKEETICVTCGKKLSDNPDDETVMCDGCWEKDYRPLNKGDKKEE